MLYVVVGVIGVIKVIVVEVIVVVGVVVEPQAIPNHHSLLFGHTAAWPSHLYLRGMFDASLIGFMVQGMKK